MPIRSYVRSTDYHRFSRGENILCGIDISVMVRPTFRTVPLSNIKRQLIDNVTALPATLATGKPSVNLNQCPTIPLALILHLANQLGPTCISNGGADFTVLQHILHRQILDSNRLIFAYQSSRQFVKKIFSGIGNSCLNSGNLPPSLLSIVGVFNSTRECFLSLSQLISKAFEVKRVSNLLAITGSNKRSDSRVNSYSLINLGQRLNCMVIDQQRDEPTSRRIQSHRDCGWFAPRRDTSAPTDGQSLITLCQPQLSILHARCFTWGDPKTALAPLEGRTSKLGTTTTSFLFEVGIL